MSYPNNTMRRFWLVTLALFAALTISPGAFAEQSKKDRKAELQKIVSRSADGTGD